MKSLLKVGVLSLIIAQLFVACNSNSKAEEKQQKDPKKKELKKDAKVDPTAGCD